MADRFEDLLRACTVRVLGGPMPGAGFFIAPGKVLTCVHVIGDSRKLIVRWERDDHPALEAQASGRVAVLADRGRPIPALDRDYPDVAVLEVDGFDGHPCVAIDHDWPSQEDTFQVFGYPSEGGAVQLTPAKLTYRGTHGTLPTAYLDLASDTIKPGMSGAALLNLRTGAVCGVVVASKDVARPNGALAVPWSAIDADLGPIMAANRAFQLDDQRWETAAGSPAVSQARPAEQVSTIRIGTFQRELHIHETAPPRIVPCQLPAQARNFVNREHELSTLTSLLTRLPQETRTAVVYVIDGTAGIGKTTLAVHWAHHARGQFPDGQLYINLRGFDPGGTPLAAADALQVLLEGLGVAPDHVPVTTDGRAALYRSMLHDRQMLIVLDNAAETSQVEPLLPGAASCVAVVTSRNRLDGLQVTYGARPLPLGLLASAESRELLARYVGEDRLAAEPDACADLIHRCGHLPLALTIVAARAAHSPGFPLRLFADELRDERSRLDALDTGDITANIRAVFSCSYRQLPPAATRVFRLLGLHPGPDISLTTAAALAGMSPRQTQQHLALITRAHLLEQHMPQRFRFHDLLRTYAAESAAEDEQPSERQLALLRALDTYLNTANNASRQLNPYRPPIPLAPPAIGTIIREFHADDEAMRWYQDEYQNLMAAIEWTASHGLDDYTWRLALAFWQYLYLCGRWHELITTHDLALAAAGRAGNRTAAAAVHANLGVSHAQLGASSAAAAHFRQSLNLYQDSADLYGQGNALDSLAWVHTLEGDFSSAITCCEQALAVYQQTGDRDGQARSLDTLGVAHTGLGDYQQGIGYGQQALEMHREIGDRIGQAHALQNVGRCYQRAGQHQEALTYLHKALAYCRELGDRHDEASTLRDLGTAEHATGQDDAARQHWDQALEILTDLRHPAAAGVQADLASLPPPQDSTKDKPGTP